MVAIPMIAAIAMQTAAAPLCVRLGTANFTAKTSPWMSTSRRGFHVELHGRFVNNPKTCWCYAIVKVNSWWVAGNSQQANSEISNRIRKEPGTYVGGSYIHLRADGVNAKGVGKKVVASK